MRRILLALAAALVSLGVAVIAAGAFLPRTHQVASEVVLAAAPEQVWAVVRDLGAMPAWWPDVEEAARIAVGQTGAGSASSPGQPFTAGAGPAERWRLVVGGFDMTLEVIDDRPPRMLVLRVSSGDGETFGGQWTYELQPTGEGTSVRLTEDGWVGPWPLRTVAWLSGYHASIDSCLAGLSRYFGADLLPSHAAPGSRPSAGSHPAEP